MKKEVLSNILLSGALQKISSLPTTKSVKVASRNPPSLASLSQWESQNHPFQIRIYCKPLNSSKIASDLRLFYNVCDGFTVSFDTIDEVTDRGQMQIKNIAAVLAYTPTNQTKLIFPESTKSLPPGKAFLISSAMPFGNVYLVYIDSSPSHPTVWFHCLCNDRLSNSWHQLVQTFTCYFRLMTANFGIAGWQMQYTLRIEEEGKGYKVAGGATQETVDWLSFYAPDRVRLYFKKREELGRECLFLEGREVDGGDVLVRQVVDLAVVRSEVVKKKRLLNAMK